MPFFLGFKHSVKGYRKCPSETWVHSVLCTYITYIDADDRLVASLAKMRRRIQKGNNQF